MPSTMTIAELREERQETLAQFALALDLKSKSSVSEMEDEARVLPPGHNRCSAEVALKLEEMSAGRIDAADLNDIIARARKALPVAA